MCFVGCKTRWHGNVHDLCGPAFGSPLTVLICTVWADDLESKSQGTITPSLALNKNKKHSFKIGMSEAQWTADIE